MSGIPFTIVLASNSPRRRELLAAELGVQVQGGQGFVSVNPGIDDAELEIGGGGRAGTGRGGGKPRLADWVASLAYLKARAGAAVYLKSAGGASQALGGADAAGASAECPDCIVIGADTLVDQDGHVLSKPVDAADAARMIRMMRGRTHGVLTGVAIVHPASGRRDVYTDLAVVSVGEIADAAIDEHIASGRWAGKSGGYNLSEQVAVGWPLEVTGDPGCVTGLPVRSLMPRLRAFAERVAAEGGVVA